MWQIEVLSVVKWSEALPSRLQVSEQDVGCLHREHLTRECFESMKIFQPHKIKNTLKSISKVDEICFTTSHDFKLEKRLVLFLLSPIENFPAWPWQPRLGTVYPFCAQYWHNSNRRCQGS
jgi:hypothetical protein